MPKDQLKEGGHSVEQIETIQVTHLAGLTEVILALPAFEALRSHFPRSRITVLTSPAGQVLLGMVPGIDEAIALGRLRRGEILSPLRGFRTLRALDQLRRRSEAGLGPDLTIDFTGGLTGLALRRLLGAGGRDPKLPLLPPAAGENLHRAHYYLRRLEGLGVRPVVAQPQLTTLPAADQRIELLLRKRRLESGRLLIGLHPGPGIGREESGWPLERFASLGRRLIDQFDARLLVLAGRAEMRVARQLAAALPDRESLLIDPLPLPDYLSLTARLSLLVGNLGAPTHLAAAVGTPVVGVSLSRGATPWEPGGDRSVIIRAPHYDLPELRDEEACFSAASRLLTTNRSQFF